MPQRGARGVGLELSTGAKLSTAPKQLTFPRATTLRKLRNKGKGRGMNLNKRQLPSNIPATREQLRAAGVTDKQLFGSYVRVTHTTWIPHSNPTSEPTNDPTSEPQLDIITRARGHHVERPEMPLTSWAALAYLGLKFWADDAAVTFVSDKKARKSVRSELGPHFLYRAEIPADLPRPDPRFPQLRCMPAEEALVCALRDVRHEEVRWFVPDVEGWSRVDLRAVQLFDAVRRVVGDDLSWAKIQEFAVRRLQSQWLKRIAYASSPGADSPMETILRLTVAGLSVDGSPLVWEAQVPIYPDATSQQPQGSAFVKWKTVSDLMCRSLKLVLFYDGDHHRDSRQYRDDAEINAFMQANGYKFLRVTRNMLDDPHTLRTRVMLLAIEAHKEKLQQEAA